MTNRSKFIGFPDHPVFRAEKTASFVGSIKIMNPTWGVFDSAFIFAAKGRYLFPKISLLPPFNMPTFEFGSPVDRKLASEVIQQWAAHPPKPIHTPPRVLPEGISESEFDQVLDLLRDAVGKENVVVGEDHRVNYGDPFQFETGEDDVGGSSCAVTPQSVEQVQAVVKLANERKLTLWTFSRGKNLGYGGPSPIVRGSVIVDLHKLNKIHEVSEEHAYALVEPGVSFFELFHYVKERKLNVWMSTPALGWGSVIGNSLDRGWGYTPNGDNCSHICGLEVVMADGSILRTGMGQLEGAKCWQLFKNGYGPGFDGLFNQSNYGIIVKMGIWMYPAAEGFMSCGVEVELESDLEPMVDILTQLTLRHTIQNHPVIGNVVRYVSAMGARSKFYEGEGAIPDDELERIRKELNIGFWHARFALYGDEEELDLNYRKIQKAFADLPGARVVGKKFLPKPGEKYVSNEDIPLSEGGGPQVGVPTLTPLSCLKYRGDDCGHIGFSPVLPPRGKEALDFYYIAKKRSAEYGFDFRAGLHLYPRHLTHINMLIYDRHSEKQRVDVHKLFIALVKDARNEGYAEYRAHVKHQELVAGMYDWPEGKGHGRLLAEKIKDALDPNGIFSEGKMGIWSEKRRKNKGVIPGQTQNETNGVNGYA